MDASIEFDPVLFTKLMSTAAAKRLKRKGHSYETIEKINERIVEKLMEKAKGAILDAAKDISVMIANGCTDQEMLRIALTAACAVAGVEVADDVHKSLIAQLN